MSRFQALNKPFFIDEHLKTLLLAIKKAQGEPFIVGGAVRDHLLERPIKDIDVEVYGLDEDALEKALAKFSLVKVGKSFGILSVSVFLNGEKKSFDVAMPRLEKKLGVGHKAFSIKTSGSLSFLDASKRRDFTINAMGIDATGLKLLDPHGGKKDLDEHILRHVSEAFSEDPLRVLRSAQFAARFNFVLHKETIDLCKSLKNELSSLSKDRIFQEMKKLLLADHPSIGLTVLKDTEAISLFPELVAMLDCPQDEEWHPEGDVWVHTLMVVDEARKIILNQGLSEDDELSIMLGALCHDIGKPQTTLKVSGRIKSPGHEQAGVEPTKSLLARMGFPKKFEDTVTPLVAEHLKPHQLYKDRDIVSDGAIRRLAARVNIDQLLMVSQADYFGRTTKDALSRIDPSASWLKERSSALEVLHKAPVPILKGRHLMELGILPGPQMGAILKTAMEAQLDGEFFDEERAVAWAKAYLYKIGILG